MNDSPICPKCGTTMVERFEFKDATGNPIVQLAIPTGQYDCMKCKRAAKN